MKVPVREFFESVAANQWDPQDCHAEKKVEIEKTLDSS